MTANILLKRNNDFCNTLREKWENMKISHRRRELIRGDSCGWKLKRQVTLRVRLHCIGGSRGAHPARAPPFAWHPSF